MPGNIFNGDEVCTVLEIDGLSPEFVPCSAEAESFMIVRFSCVIL